MCKRWSIDARTRFRQACWPALMLLQLHEGKSAMRVAARLDLVDDSSKRHKNVADGLRRFVRVFMWRHFFSKNAAKMATPETFSETGSETMYEKV